MSYARKLVSMSRDRVGTPARVIGDDAAPPREEIVETAVQAPPPAPPVAHAARAAPTANEPVRSVVVPARVERDAPVASPRARSQQPAAIHHHETVEHHTIIAAAEPPRTVPRPAPPAPPAPPVAPASVALPPRAQWLTEDASVPDPLVESADTDALRELMRSVRQWTSSPPTVIEQQVNASAAVATPEAPSLPAPHQVSIGNVTITVEDAPPARTQRGAAPTRNAGDRIARNHIRER